MTGQWVVDKGIGRQAKIEEDSQKFFRKFCWTYTWKPKTANPRARTILDLASWIESKPSWITHNNSLNHLIYPDQFF